MSPELKRRAPAVSIVLAALLAAAALLFPGHSLASHSQEMILQDDEALIYASPAQVSANLTRLKAMGVDRVRVSVVWSLVAPQASDSTEPSFDATDPAAYPPGAWARWDYIDRVAQQIGIGVYFQPTAPAPVWATSPVYRNEGFRSTSNINGRLYGQFVQAVGARYNGQYVAPDLNGQMTPLPAIDYWGIYNEPNIGGWTVPQWQKVHGHVVQASSAIYRRMLDSAYGALVATGHAKDTILIGETAAYGDGRKGYGDSTDPMVFMRDLYCVDGGYRPLRGATATALGCPAKGTRSTFLAAHPGLFAATGWAHHPYDFSKAPSYRRPDPNAATLSGISHLEVGLNRVFRAYGKATKLPVYITEWGVQSREPSPYIPFSQAQQAEYLNEGEYMAWRDPRIRSFAQFLLTDAAPNPQYKKGTKAYWSTFQSGLLFYPGGHPKPSYFAFELPLWLSSPHHGRRVPIWAQIRPSPRVGTIQFRPRGSSSWVNVAHVAPRDREGFISTTVTLRSAGSVRLRWDADPRHPVYGRTVSVN